MLGAVQMRPETYAFIGDFAQFGKAEDLITAGVRKDCAVPRHELVQAAEFADQFVARPQIQMIGIAQNDLRAEIFQRFIAQTLHCALRTARHEERSVNRSVRRRHASAARTGGVGL